MHVKALISLICPRCGADLQGLDSDNLFACSECALVYEPNADGLGGPYPLRQSPHRPEGLNIALPFWRMKLEPMLLPEGIHAPEYAYIPAFDVRRRAFFGDPGMKWTVDQLIIAAEAPRRPLLGMTLGSAEAEELATYYVMKALDVQKDITGFDYEIRFSETMVMLVEFTDEDTVLVDPVTQERYGATAFCDLPVLRAHRV